MDEQDQDIVIPIIREEIHADAVPVVTGGVRVTKHVEMHDEILQQELRKSHVDVKRVKTDRVVDGPQQPRRVGKELIIPVVSEVLRIEKQWVVTEEIHITEVEETETVDQKITVSREQARIERLDNAGNVIGPIDNAIESSSDAARPVSMLQQAAPSENPLRKKTSGRARSILKNRRPASD